MNTGNITKRDISPSLHEWVITYPDGSTESFSTRREARQYLKVWKANQAKTSVRAA